MSLIDAATNLLTGGAFGAIGGIAEKLLTQRMANKQEQKEWDHIRQMHTLQAQMQAQSAREGLELAETQGEYAGLTESIKHDAELKFESADKLLESHPKLGAFVRIMQTLTNVIRSLFRPGLTVYLLTLSVNDPVFLPLAAAAVGWWLGSRGTAAKTRKI